MLRGHVAEVWFFKDYFSYVVQNLHLGPLEKRAGSNLLLTPEHIFIYSLKTEQKHPHYLKLFLFLFSNNSCFVF